MGEYSMNFKITGVIILCFLISLSVLYYVNEWYLSENDREKAYINQLKNLETDSKKIYLVGNSRLGVINKNYIQNRSF